MKLSYAYREAEHCSRIAMKRNLRFIAINTGSVLASKVLHGHRSLGHKQGYTMSIGAEVLVHFSE